MSKAFAVKNKDQAMSREELMLFVQQQIDLVEDQVFSWVSLVDDMMSEFIIAKDKIEKNNHDFRKKTRRENKQFIEATREDLHNKGFNL